jgi:CRP/FNR family cyclic AMP-dependent transcriptional regulator
MSEYLPPLFKHLDPEDQALIRGALQKRSLAAGESLFLQGDSGNELFFIEHGRVRVSRISDEGRELLITYLSSGDLLGELSVLTGAPRSADTLAIDAVTLHSMSIDHFMRCIQRPRIAHALMTCIAWRLHDSSERLSDLVLYNVYRNVLETLRHLAEPRPYQGITRLIVENRPTHQEIAALVGSSREVITRTLRHLQSDGKIAIEGRRVVIF